MRTTLDLDDDMLATAKELAELHGRTAGQVVSELMRQALTSTAASTSGATARNGMPLLPLRDVGAQRPTLALVNKLRDLP